MNKVQMYVYLYKKCNNWKIPKNIDRQEPFYKEILKRKHKLKRRKN